MEQNTKKKTSIGEYILFVAALIVGISYAAVSIWGWFTR